MKDRKKMGWWPLAILALLVAVGAGLAWMVTTVAPVAKTTKKTASVLDDIANKAQEVLHPLDTAKGLFGEAKDWLTEQYADWSVDLSGAQVVQE